MEIGDVVRLTSGEGYPMTVERVANGVVECAWFEKIDGGWSNLQRNAFASANLERVAS